MSRVTCGHRFLGLKVFLTFRKREAERGGGLAARDAVKSPGWIPLLRDTATWDFSEELLNAKV